VGLLSMSTVNYNKIRCIYIDCVFGPRFGVAQEEVAGRQLAVDCGRGRGRRTTPKALTNPCKVKSFWVSS
jgi:hypothetical protein